MNTVGQFTPNLRAKGTIPTLSFVRISATDDNGALVCGADGLAIGVTTDSTRNYADDDHAESGETVHLQPGGIVLVESVGAITTGDHIVSDAAGKADLAELGTDTNLLGVALEAIAAGKIGLMMWRPTYNTP